MIRTLLLSLFLLASCAENSSESGLLSGSNPPPSTSSTSSPELDLPEVIISDAANITNANKISYSVTGSCENPGQSVDIFIGSLEFNSICIAGTFVVNSLDVSSLSDGTVDIIAEHSDSENNIGQNEISISKDTATALVEINSPTAINQSNQNDYSISGTCTENGELVDVNIGSINKQPNCISGGWSTGNFDASSLSDGTISISADHSNATQALLDVEKDVVSSVVTITSSSDITTSNESSYLLSGSCSENSVIVDINIGSINVQPNCSSQTWSTGFIDVSSLDDGPISITANHASATEVSTDIQKITLTPTISSLSVSSTLSDSSDISWSLDDPGGFTINDYIINYKIKTSSTWLTFDDGTSTSTNSTVTALSPSATYQFRIKVLYDSSEESPWSNIAEGITQPDSEVFGANKAMNVGGASTSTVIAHQDNTEVTLNGNSLINLNKGEVHTFSSAPFDIIDANRPIFTSGRRGSGSDVNKGNIVWQPTAWAGKSFSFNTIRYNPQKLEVYAIEDATVEIKQGSTIVESATISANSGATLSWSVYGSFQVVSTGSILAFHYSNSGGAYVDPKPLLPGSTELIGIPSRSMRLTTSLDATNFYGVHSDSNTFSASLNKSQVQSYNGRGTSSYYQEHSMLISADKKISAAAFADSNGGCATPFLPTNLMRKNYALNVPATYVAFASKESGTIDLLDTSDNVLQTLTLSKSGNDPNAPYKARVGSTPAGIRFQATTAIMGIFQPSSDTGGAKNDETIMYGTND